MSMILALTSAAIISAFGMYQLLAHKKQAVRISTKRNTRS